jgi:hypothetical protein
LVDVEVVVISLEISRTVSLLGVPLQSPRFLEIRLAFNGAQEANCLGSVGFKGGQSGTLGLRAQKPMYSSDWEAHSVTNLHA